MELCKRVPGLALRPGCPRRSTLLSPTLLLASDKVEGKPVGVPGAGAPNSRAGGLNEDSCTTDLVLWLPKKVAKIYSPDMVDIASNTGS